MTATGRVKGAARHLVGTSAGLRAGIAAARRRRRDLVLMYHRLAPGGARPHEVVPCVDPAIFRRQVQVLGDLGEIVPLRSLLQPRTASDPVRFALTFDDDYASHLRHASPVLREVGAPATCFLSGRQLAGAGAYWWEVLEACIEESGIAAVAAALGLSPGPPASLAAQAEGTQVSRRLAERGSTTPADHLSHAQIAQLSDAGWTVGFHTVDHEVLPRLDDAGVHAALRAGVSDLADAAGQPVDLLGYPHGKADARVARAARSAGFRAAWTGDALPMRHSDDPFLLGRYEPGPLEVDAFAAMVAIRLNRLAPDVQRRRQTCARPSSG